MPWQAQAEETRRVLREMCDAADRAIDDQVSRSELSLNFGDGLAGQAAAVVG
jgi:hypothetical protein